MKYPFKGWAGIGKAMRGVKLGSDESELTRASIVCKDVDNIRHFSRDARGN